MKILVVDDHALVRSGLSQVLQGLDAQQPTQVLEAPDCGQAFVIARTNPDLDLILLDYHLPDMNGLDALTVFGQRHPELPVVILSGSVNPGIMQRVLAQGAAGFITKSGKSAELLSAIRQVLSGEIYVSREFASMLSKDPAASGQSPPVFTARQEEVLRLLQNGLSNREIGTQLSLSDETVKSHVASILRALGVSTRLQAVRQAARWGYDKASWPAR